MSLHSNGNLFLMLQSYGSCYVMDGWIKLEETLFCSLPPGGQHFGDSLRPQNLHSWCQHAILSHILFLECSKTGKAELKCHMKIHHLENSKTLQKLVSSHTDFSHQFGGSSKKTSFYHSWICVLHLTFIYWGLRIFEWLAHH